MLFLQRIVASLAQIPWNDFEKELIDVGFKGNLTEGSAIIGNLASKLVAMIGVGRLVLIVVYLLIGFLPFWLWDNHLADMPMKTQTQIWKHHSLLVLRFAVGLLVLVGFVWIWYGLCRNWWGLLAALIIIAIRWAIYDRLGR